MAEYQSFRSALNGFNREDVVNYIEYLNNKHAAELNQIKNDMSAMEQELTALRSEPKADPQLEADLADAQAKCALLEETLAQVRQELADVLQQAAKNDTCAELETYRRAERTERIANQRVKCLYEQANGLLADATVKVDEAATQLSDISTQVLTHLNALQTAVTAGKTTLQDAAAALFAVRPVSDEE